MDGQTRIVDDHAANPEPVPERGEFSRGWAIVLASMIGIGCGLAALPFYTAGVFAPHLAREFGWSMGEIMAGLTVTTVAVMGAGPVAGILCDRYGTRRVALISIACFGLALVSFTTLDNSLTRFYATWAIAATLGAGTLPITFTRTVNRWFDKNRGLALGLAMTGTGLFGLVGKPIIAWVVEDQGWRTGYLVLGLLPLILALPLVWLLFRDPVGAVVETSKVDEELPGLTRGEAFRNWRFWLIAFILVPISFGLAGAVPNLEPILLDRGLDSTAVLTLTPLIGLASIGGRLIGGWLLDRLWAPAVAFVFLGMPAASFLILAGGHLSYFQAGFAILLIGFALGIEYDVVAFLTSRFFGMRAYAAIYGIFYVCFSTGAGFGPLAFGMVRDSAQSFAPALHGVAILLPLCAAGFLCLGKYPDLARVSRDAP